MLRALSGGPARVLERAMGIEPTALAWEARVLPLYDARRARDFTGVSANCGVGNVLSGVKSVRTSEIFAGIVRRAARRCRLMGPIRCSAYDHAFHCYWRLDPWVLHVESG